MIEKVYFGLMKARKNFTTFFSYSDVNNDRMSFTIIIYADNLQAKTDFLITVVKNKERIRYYKGKSLKDLEQIAIDDLIKYVGGVE